MTGYPCDAALSHRRKLGGDDEREANIAGETLPKIEKMGGEAP
jgi:hypothetical protein